MTSEQIPFCANLPFKRVIVHPIVVDNVPDHHLCAIAAKTPINRVLGLLVGSVNNDKILDVSDSFAIPLNKENLPNIEYLEAISKKLSNAAKEKIVGWYHTGSKMSTNDIAINDLLERIIPNPILVVIQGVPKELCLPTKAYIAVQEVQVGDTPPTKSFKHVPSEIKKTSIMTPERRWVFLSVLGAVVIYGTLVSTIGYP